MSSDIATLTTPRAKSHPHRPPRTRHLNKQLNAPMASQVRPCRAVSHIESTSASTREIRIRFRRCFFLFMKYGQAEHEACNFQRSHALCKKIDTSVCTREIRIRCGGCFFSVMKSGRTEYESYDFLHCHHFKNHGCKTKIGAARLSCISLRRFVAPLARELRHHFF